MQTAPSIREQIMTRLSVLQPTLLEVTDDSASHAGHAGATAHSARTGHTDGSHFVLTIVAPVFAGKPLVVRHRLIYAELDDLMKTHIHALKIDARDA